MGHVRIVVAIAIGVLSVGVLSLAWRLQSEMGVRDHMTAQIQNLQRQLAEKSRREIFELQKECASQAEKVFRQEGFKLGLHTEVISGKENTSNTDYQSHYNLGLNKCFVSIDDFTIYPNNIHNRFLLDTVEHHEYAEYTSPAGIDLPPMACRLIPSPGMETQCGSEADYEAFVARYMQ